MPIITKISVQKNRTDRYNIFLDEVYAFSVDEGVLIRYSLKKGQELSELDLTQIQYEDEIRKAYNNAIQFLSFRMRSQLEIRQHLQKKEWNESVIQTVLQTLKEREYTDDLEFAKAYVRTQISSGKKGPQSIRQELVQKGITESFIEQSIALYSEEQQVEHAIKLGDKLAGKNMHLSERILKQKLEQFLITKGFPYSVINIALEEIQFEKDEDEEWQSLFQQAEKLYRKYNHLPESEYQQKIKQALFRKGFELDLINRYIDEKRE
ncbi:recombination regulator RecX [Bacillus niameyensis]|uniref:recombination regulator RecX n=1 Tax=Bacillus niameyensis TaxID=1522308 RepID=UPI0007820EA3|nr:recombination regulator RecX [Bacillus niameyensis]